MTLIIFIHSAWHNLEIIPFVSLQKEEICNISDLIPQKSEPKIEFLITQLKFNYFQIKAAVAFGEFQFLQGECFLTSYLFAIKTM